MSEVTAASASGARHVGARVALLLGAVAMGLVLNRFLQVHLANLETVAVTDPIAARAQLATEIQIGGLGLFALTAGIGLSLLAASRRAARDLRFPPAGVWSAGATRILTGPPARRAGYVGMVLGALLVVCSLAGGALAWETGARLRTCRANVPPPAMPIAPVRSI